MYVAARYRNLRTDSSDATRAMMRRLLTVLRLLDRPAVRVSLHLPFARLVNRVDEEAVL